MDHRLAAVASPPSPPVASGGSPVPIAATMRRIHAELREGAVPTYEALLALEH